MTATNMFSNFGGFRCRPRRRPGSLILLAEKEARKRNIAS